jgi:hypothetical protein
MTKNRIIDHLVYSVPDLDKAMDDLENLLGIRPIFGGHHTTKGTKNALLNLGEGCYLEILAVDDQNKDIQPPRWMGIDLIEKPKMTRWCLKSNNLENDAKVIKAHLNTMGEISGGQREIGDGKLLKWEMILPLAAPEVELIPFMVNWGNSTAHPTDGLEAKCQLLKLELTHPSPDSLITLFKNLSLSPFKIEKGEEVKILAHLRCPNGLVQLG